MMSLFFFYSLHFTIFLSSSGRGLGPESTSVVVFSVMF